MDIKVTKPVKPVIHKSVFEIRHDWMFGDADGDGSETIFLPKSKEAELPEFLSLLEKLKLAYPNGKGGYDGYGWVPGIWKYSDSDFIPDTITEEEAEEAKEASGIYLETPHGGFDGEEPSFQSYTIFYWDENGVQHHVEVAFTQEEKDLFQKEINAARKQRGAFY